MYYTPVKCSETAGQWTLGKAICPEPMGGLILTYRINHAAELRVLANGETVALITLTVSKAQNRQLYALQRPVAGEVDVVFSCDDPSFVLSQVEFCPADAVVTGTNPVVSVDMPDLDIIRVDDTYYLVSTTMHNMPGCTILRSYDLIHWEIAANVYDTLPTTDARRMLDGKQIYGQGMWAPSFRYHKGSFHITFTANDTHCTYHYQAPSIDGPWSVNIIEGFYHDCSLFFDDDDRVYIVYGNNRVWLTELDPSLSRPKSDGLHRLLLEYGKGPLGYEGSHLYKHDGQYVLFTIHSNRDGWYREESCFTAASLTDDFTGGVILHDDMGYHKQGVAQGGMVDTPDGRWYCFLFQDRGASGRMPILMPMHWENGRPVVGENGRVSPVVCNLSTRPGVQLKPIAHGDDFIDDRLDASWQWNHEPSWERIRIGGGTLRITTANVCDEVTGARNTLTQRASSPVCVCEVTVCAKDLKNGDFAGSCAFQSHYACIGIRKLATGFAVGTIERNSNRPEDAVSTTEMPWSGDSATFRMVMDFDDLHDRASFYVLKDGAWCCLLKDHRMRFTLDHFTGNKAALFVMATEEIGGTASFSHFTLNTYESVDEIPD